MSLHEILQGLSGEASFWQERASIKEVCELAKPLTEVEWVEIATTTLTPEEKSKLIIISKRLQDLCHAEEVASEVNQFIPIGKLEDTQLENVEDENVDELLVDTVLQTIRCCLYPPAATLQELPDDPEFWKTADYKTIEESFAELCKFQISISNSVRFISDTTIDKEKFTPLELQIMQMAEERLAILYQDPIYANEISAYLGQRGATYAGVLRESKGKSYLVLQHTLRYSIGHKEALENAKTLADACFFHLKTGKHAEEEYRDGVKYNFHAGAHAAKEDRAKYSTQAVTLDAARRQAKQMKYDNANDPKIIRQNKAADGLAKLIEEVRISPAFTNLQGTIKRVCTTAPNPMGAVNLGGRASWYGDIWGLSKKLNTCKPEEFFPFLKAMLGHRVIKAANVTAGGPPFAIKMAIRPVLAMTSTKKTAASLDESVLEQSIIENRRRTITAGGP